MHIKEHFGGIILLSVILGFLIPGPGLFLQPYLQYLLMLLMFVSVLKIDWHELIRYLKDFKHLLLILLVIHIFAGLIALIFKGFLSQELFLGLILIAVAPSGLSAVFLCNLCKGKPAEALTFTSISNLLSPITMPFLVFIFAGAQVQVSILSMFWIIFKIIVIPFIAAQIVIHLSVKQTVIKIGKNISLPLLIAIIWAITAPTRDQLISEPVQALILFAIISAVIVITFFTGWWLGRTHEEKVTFGITSSYKNFTLATVIALTLFEPIVALPAIVYTIANNVWLAPMHWFFDRDHYKKK